MAFVVVVVDPKTNKELTAEDVGGEAAKDEPAGASDTGGSAGAIAAVSSRSNMHVPGTVQVID